MAFAFGSIAQWMHVVLSFTTHPVYTSANVCILRVLISAFNVALFIIGILTVRRTVNHFDGRTPRPNHGIGIVTKYLICVGPNAVILGGRRNGPPLFGLG